MIYLNPFDIHRLTKESAKEVHEFSASIGGSVDVPDTIRRSLLLFCFNGMPDFVVIAMSGTQSAIPRTAFMDALDWKRR